MQTVGSSLLAILESDQRDLPPVDLFEFYAPEETELFPENAEKLYAASSIVWNGWTYERQAISRGDISRFIDGKFNNVSISLSNADLSVATWLSTTDLEGYRLVIRCISRRVEDDSLVLGVFRCESPERINKTTVGIAAKQDLGSIENELPFDEYSPKCSVRKFKDAECLAGQLIGDKSATYQAATACNRSARQCVQYDNYKAFKGTRFNAVTGNFRVSQQRGGGGGALLSLFGLGTKRVTRQYSSQDSAPYGQAVVLGLGRTQVEGIPTVYADTGEYLAGEWEFGEGEAQALLNLRNVTSGWAGTFQSLFTHLGKYGYEVAQAPQGFFGSTFEHHSHKVYVEVTIEGENPDTGDPAPTLVAVVMWIKIPVFDQTCFTDIAWSDNPVEHLRYLLTEPRSLNYNSTWINNEVAADTAGYCNDPLIDQSGSEDVYISEGSGTPGTDFKRYRSTGLLDTYYFRYILGLDANHSAQREAVYNTFDPSTNPSVTPATHYRKRYTSNFHIREKIKTVDFIFKSLLPCFRGYLVTGSDGRLQIRTEKPTITSFLRSSVSGGATSIAIEDALAWKMLNLSVLFALVGVGEATSETRRVTAVEYSTAGNSITLTASGSGTASGGTFSGGTTSIQAEGKVTIGSVAACTVTIDGQSVTYTPGADDTTGTIAAMLTVIINANPTISRFCQAIWTPNLPTQVLLRSKLGTLTLATGLTSAHTTAELVAHVHMPFSDVAFGALSRGNIIEDSFDYPLASRQTSYNRFTMQFNDAVQDFQATKLNENDEDHQERVNKIVPLEISGACVDNYHQASRLVLAARYKYREGKYFNSWSTAGLALLLEEGDVACTNHTTMPGKRNLMLRIEELRITQTHRVNIVGRLYADEQFPQSPTERTIPLTTGIGWPSATPGAVTNLVLTSPASGTIVGTFDFAAFVGSQQARIEIKRDGEASFSDTGQRISPDSNNDGAFELSGLPAGTTYVRVTPFSVAGDGPSTTGAYGGGYGEDYGGAYGG